MANITVASLLFRRGDLRPAKQLAECAAAARKGNRTNRADGARLGRASGRNGSVWTSRTPPMHRIALDVSGKSPMPIVDTGGEPAAFAVGYGRAVNWRLPGKDRGVLELRSAKTKAVIGHVDNQRIDLGHGVQGDRRPDAKPIGVQSRSRYWKATLSTAIRAARCWWRPASPRTPTWVGSTIREARLAGTGASRPVWSSQSPRQFGFRAVPRRRCSTRSTTVASASRALLLRRPPTARHSSKSARRTQRSGTRSTTPAKSDGRRSVQHRPSTHRVGNGFRASLTLPAFRLTRPRERPK